MPITDVQKKWMRENTVVINARLTKKSDADIIEYLKDKQTATEIKRGLRLLIQLEKEKNSE